MSTKKYLDDSGLLYFWGKIKSFFAKGNGKIFYGTCSTAGATADKVVTCSSFTSGDLAPGTTILIEFSNYNSATVDDLTLNINGTGAVRIKKILNGSVGSLAMAGEIRGTVNQFIYYDAGIPTWLLTSSDTDTTYATITTSEINTGTGTGMRVVSASVLRSNFYTETEIDTMMGGKKIWTGTQAAYDQLTPSSDTLYFITESSS